MASKLHNSVLKINQSTFIRNIIDIGQNLTKLLHKIRGIVFFPDTMYVVIYLSFSCVCIFQLATSCGHSEMMRLMLQLL